MVQENAFGSLSGSLLARKGGAKPAMRPQAFRFDEGDSTAADDDCGWNDMGSEMLTPEQRATLLPSDDGEGAQPAKAVRAVPAEIESNGAPVPPIVVAQRDLVGKIDGDDAVSDVAVSDVNVNLDTDTDTDVEADAEQSAFLARLARESEPEDALSIPEPPRREAPPVQRAAPGSKAKSAFTLRLDKAQHLRLRLATAFAHKSAQKLVVEALDEYLAKHFPDLPA